MKTSNWLPRAALILTAVFALALGQGAVARDGHGGGASGSHVASHSQASHTGVAGAATHAHVGRQDAGSAAIHAAKAPRVGNRHAAVAGVQRSATGKIARSPAVKRAFMRSHPCPSTGKSSGGCPGYVIDHVVPLKRGGADLPANFQTKAEASAKDRTE